MGPELHPIRPHPIRLRIHLDPRQRVVVDHESRGWDRTCTCVGAGTRNAVVLDPFAGAMTTAIACERLGRDFTGIELNDEFARLGADRVLAEREKARQRELKQGKK